VSMVTVSPLTYQRLSIEGKVLSDCYYFTSRILPDRHEVISQMISGLRRQTSGT
jgi:hypothetical protein